LKKPPASSGGASLKFIDRRQGFTMKRFTIGWIVHTIALIVVAQMVQGIYIANWQTAILAAFVLGMLNVFLRPLIILLTLPLTILSLGLFTLVINGILFYAASVLVKGFVVANFWSAMWGALLFSVISFFLNILLKPGGRGKTMSPSGSTRYRKVIDAETVPGRMKK